MRFSETGFRPLYHNLAIFPLCGAVRAALEHFPGSETADGALVWGYCGPDAGFTLEVLAAAKREEDAWICTRGNDEVRSFIRIEAVENEDFLVQREPDKGLLAKYARKLEMLQACGAPEEIERTRSFHFLDGARHPVFIDDVLVYLEKRGLEPEGCRARLTGVEDYLLRAELIEEPFGDFGVHQGDSIAFVVRQDEETGQVTCHAELSPLDTIYPEMLADGKMLKEAIHRFREDMDDGEALLWILRILRDSDVWIPCNAIVGGEDQKTMERMIEEAGDDLESMIGKTFTARQNIRLVPDILQKDGRYFFPAFTTEEDMGEYGENFSKLQQSFMDVLRAARSSDQKEPKLSGIVINAFTEPFILPESLYEEVEKMESRLEGSSENG